MDTTERLMQMQNAVFDLYGYRSRPAGREWASMVLDLARRIIAEGLAEKITEETLDDLTRENFHTVGTAAEIAKALFDAGGD